MNTRNGNQHQLLNEDAMLLEDPSDDRNQNIFMETPEPSPSTARNAASELGHSIHSGLFKGGPQLTVSNQGKVYYKEITTVGSHASDHEESSSHLASWSGQTPKRQNQHEGSVLYSARRRLDTGGFSHRSIVENKITDWEKVQQAVQDNHGNNGQRISSGAWKVPTISDISSNIWNKIRFPFKKTFDAVDEIKSTTTFAVLTFTSRQAAVAARHCLADGRGVGRWIPVEDIPVPPLADAAVCDICDCRGCCRPVTVTIHPKQQLIRRYVTLALLASIFIFYTLPLTFASAFVAPEKLNNIIPGIEEAAKKNVLLSNLLSGIMPALFYSLFFALCPILFKTLANSGSNAVSLNQAEFNALQVSPQLSTYDFPLLSRDKLNYFLLLSIIGGSC